MVNTNGKMAPSLLRPKQLLNHLVDERAKAIPDALYTEIPYSVSSYEDGFRKITYAVFANSINGLALWLHDTLGPGENFQTLAYMGPNDLRYNILLLAAVKAGYKMLFTSPRNSIVAHSHLFKVLDCHVMLTTNPLPPGVSNVVSSCKLSSYEIPSIEELFDNTYPHFEYHKTYEEHNQEPLVAVHSSGSTGLPKPIVWPHSFAQSFIDWLSIPPPEGYALNSDRWTGSRLFNTLPPFHAGGLYANFIGALYNQSTVVWPLAGVPPSARLILDALNYTTADCALLAPPFLEEVGQNKDLLDFLSTRLGSVFFAGGNISKDSGDKISKKLNLFVVIGMTEAGVIPNIRPADKWPTQDWAYFYFHPGYGLEFQHVSENQYEAVVVRDPNPDKKQPIFHVIPELRHEWRTRDLYIPHPTKPDLWLYHARTDDIIVFLTGEKTNPNSMEYYISLHPELKSVLVLGTLRFQAALLVEPITSKHLSTSERAQLVERIWPTIDEANQECPRHAKIAKSHILFTTPEKPMERAGKGTVQRRSTLDIYAAEIEALYADAEKMAASVDSPSTTVDFGDINSVETFVHEAIVNVTNSIELFHNDDLFVHRIIDSLQALQLMQILKQALDITELGISTLYTNTTVSSLAKAIVQLSDTSSSIKKSSEESRRTLLDNTLKKYQLLIDGIASPHPSAALASSKGRVFALTGSTGALGSYVLQVLSRDPSITHIYCLNRSADSEALQKKRNQARDLPIDFPTDRITFLTTDLSKPNFGLDSNIFKKLQNEVTDLIHNAWPVNFNLTLGSFEKSLQGVVNLVDFATSASLRPSIMFFSSISSLSNHHFEKAVPETVITDVLAPVPMGYAESKYIAERILDYAACKFTSVTIQIARIGQVTGPIETEGVWSKQEWFPSLVQSSIHLGVIPSSLGSGETAIDWVPMDLLAGVLVELSLDKSSINTGGAILYHPISPKPTAWSTLLLTTIYTVAEFKCKTLTAVTFDEWLRLVRKEAEGLDSDAFEIMLEKNPAIKLLSFMRVWQGVEGRLLRTQVEQLKRASSYSNSMVLNQSG